MMTPDYQALIERTIALEGLLRVAQSRTDLPAELISMLASESAEIAQALAVNGFNEEEVTETVIETPVEEPVEEPAEAPAPAEVPEPAVEEVAEDYDDDFETREMALETEAGMTTQVDEDFLPAHPRLEDKIASQVAGDLSHLFSLNDKFRFRRQLFGDSQEQMEETLRILGDMNTPEEAFEYLADDLCLDPDDPDVRDFLSIIAKHFA